ncbi:MAG: hypothetical protein BGO12_22755 [Verrucomicrobia bacterium 61-8]|nr:helix-turn-helix transcriptional regulator [Verrucomicrobiota bacterium]OJV19925.1 MAG: hypothetical protein BGO12_22755 [Verrucomicrobia bacterium 61-8]
MSKLLSEPIQNWNDLRLKLVWIYDGPIRRFASGVYPGTPAVAWHLRKGHATLRFGSATQKFGSGTWIFPRGEEGLQTFSDDAIVLSVRFVAEWPTGESLFDRSRTVEMPENPLRKLTRIAERLSGLVGHEFPGVTYELPNMPGSLRRHIEIQRLFFGWMREYIRAMERAGLEARTITRLDSRVRHAIHVMESRSLGQPLRERELAVEAGLSVSHLHKLFVQALNLTPTEYWEKKRIHSARLALLESSQSVKSIAYSLGFKSLPHFSLWVSKRLGKSPREIRKMSGLLPPEPDN